MVADSTRRDTLGAATAGLIVGAVGSVRIAQAQQTPATAAPAAPAASFGQITKPADGVDMPQGYARTLAQFAYAWGWPLVNMANRRASIIQAPKPGLLGGIVRSPPAGGSPC